MHPRLFFECTCLFLEPANGRGEMGVDGRRQAVVAPLRFELLARTEVLCGRHATRADDPQKLVEVPVGWIGLRG